jgi:hypothetical protein
MNLVEAEDDLDDQQSRDSLAAVQALLTSGLGALEQAGERVRSGDASLAATANIWYASLLLHSSRAPDEAAQGGDDGVLHQVAELRDDDKRALDTRADAATVPWQVPLVALVLLLLVTQLYLSARFRRTLNPCLLAATVLVIVGGVGLHRDVSAVQDELREARVKLVERVAQGSVETQDAASQRELRQRLGQRCDVDAGACGRTVQAWSDHVIDSAGDTGTGESSSTLAREAVTHAGRAGDRADPVFLVPAVAALVLVLVGLGLYRPLDDYRFTAS